MMKRLLSGVLTATMALAFVAGASTKAEATLFAAICNDLACSGGDDFIVQDNTAPDTIPLVGGINFSTSAFGFTLLVNTSQSKPIIGSAAAPQLDLTYTATSGAAGGTVFLFASDTDFLGLGSKTLELTNGGTNSGGSGTITARAWGGTNNTALSFSGANLLCTLGPQSGASFSGGISCPLTPAVSPFSLTIGVAITRTTAGTTTGDANFATVPEPATMAVFGLGMLGAGIAARRRRRA
jgi:hypothetical protein